jgi:hypothetical protein
MAKLAPKENKHVLVSSHTEKSGGIVLTERIPGFLSRWTNWQPGRYEVTAVRYSILNPQAPPVVVVRQADKEINHG